MQAAIIGGGAAGLMAAITAAENGHSVTLFERQARVGRKLLATGNGRCNLSNTNLSTDNFHGVQADFVRPALDAFPTEAALDFFHNLGLLTVTEPSGRVYPLSDQAGSVVDVLRFAAEAAGVEMRTGEEVLSLSRSRNGFTLRLENGTFHAERVVVCCGGMAGGKLGGTRSGYELLASLGHSRTALYPALVQLKTAPDFVRSLKGVRADAAVTLEKRGNVIAGSCGEVQFTDYGVSGPAIFEISRAAATGGEGLTVHLDLLRDYAQAEILALLRQRCADFPALTNENLLTGILHNRLGRTVLRYAGCGLAESVTALRERDIANIARAIKDFALPVSGTTGFDNAQVTAGGISTAEFDPETLCSRIVPGVYAAGEVLDVDGDCGGYNLQWAWASGRKAGQLL